MTETGLIIGQAVFLLLLYLFIAFVVRASTRALKSSELEMTPPRQPEPPPSASPGAVASSHRRRRLRRWSGATVR